MSFVITEPFDGIPAFVLAYAEGRPHDFRDDDEALADVACDSWVSDHPDVYEALSEEERQVLEDWFHVLARFAVKHVAAEEPERDSLERTTRLSQCFDRGNFAAGYEGETMKMPDGFDTGEQNAFLLGFFSSYANDEIPTEYADRVCALRESVQATDLATACDR